jgi:preprotein translocase subunit SecB
VAGLEVTPTLIRTTHAKIIRAALASNPQFSPTTQGGYPIALNLAVIIRWQSDYQFTVEFTVGFNQRLDPEKVGLTGDLVVQVPFQSDRPISAAELKEVDPREILPHAVPHLQEIVAHLTMRFGFPPLVIPPSKFLDDEVLRSLR